MIMGRTYRGPYARPSTYPVPYATASVWGTGIDSIHSYHGEGPPLRTLGREGTIGSSPVATDHPRSRDYQSPAESSGIDPPQETTWGYPVDYGPDSFGSGADAPISDGDTAPGVYQYMDDRPAWGDAVENERVRRMASIRTPWGANAEVMRATRDGAARYRIYTESDGSYAPVTAEQPNSFPTETVSEGWRNKVTSFVADADPSDPSQYEVQTSMRQRYGTRDNNRAVLRSTDEPRAKIASRVMAMVEKVYSTGERSYDMFPYQIDQMERPFRYRTAGVGPAAWMEANEFNAVAPIQRTPPPEPALGFAEVSSEYGYTGEDTMYYG
jgi:hypothetical protein